MLFYNPRNPLERYNMPDTLKCQHTFKLTRGHCLYSDMGRIFCSIVDDASAGTTPSAGNIDARRCVAARWGHQPYQEDAQRLRPLNGHDSFLVEAGKYGLGRRDLAANVNWFSKVAVADDGAHDASIPHNSRAGDARRPALRDGHAGAVPHLRRTRSIPAAAYPRRPIALPAVRRPRRSRPTITAATSRPENGRGFENNRIYHLGRAWGSAR